MTAKTLLMLVGVAAVMCAAAPHPRAQENGGEPHYQPFVTIWTGVYAKAEADRGRQTAARLCSRCHGPDLEGGTAPRLTGPGFFDRWNNLRLHDVVVHIQGSMPHGYDFFVPADSTREVVAFMLQESGVPAGPKPISGDLDVLTAILITRAPEK